MIVPPGPSAESIGAVAYAPQVRPVSQQTQARQNVFAAPLDALAFSGMQTNGSMEIDQEHAGAVISVYSAEKPLIDGWRMNSTGQDARMKRSTVAPPGFANSLEMTLATATPNPPADYYAGIYNCIEGFRVSRLAFGTMNACPVTIAFWVQAKRTGMYSGVVGTVAGSRVYAFTFNINASLVWEYKTITVPGDTSTATPAGNALGLFVSFAVMAGTNLQTTPNVWNNSGAGAATGTINGVAALDDVFRLAGLVVLPGIEAPSADRSPLIMRPYDQELVTCQRYYEKSYQTGDIPGTIYAPTNLPGASQFFMSPLPSAQYYGSPSVTFKTRKRSTPSVKMYSYLTGGVQNQLGKPSMQ